MENSTKSKIIIEVPEESLQSPDSNWIDNIKPEFDRIQRELDSISNSEPSNNYSNVTWLFFFLKYGQFLSSEEIRQYIKGNGSLAKFFGEVLDMKSVGGGHLTGNNLFQNYILNRPNIDVDGIKIYHQNVHNLKHQTSKPKQIIYYGAPGTGKSYAINEITKKYDTVRTTFHPDSDYSTFVGAYKPVMDIEDVEVVPVVLNAGGVVFDQNKGTYKEKRISYKFVRQAFIKAYLAAWKKYAEGGDDVKPQFLVIEEINRGNCAQIFGDLFQLLDRDGNGFSKYPIDADTDLCNEITFAFNKEENGDYNIDANTPISIEGAVDGYTSNYGATLSEDVQQGRVLLLPPNLYIWATMNTSDQSLFPIDSAFKRRWEWNYVKITDAYKKDNNGDYIIEDGKRIRLGWRVGTKDYNRDWWEFLQAINEKIAEASSSDDKKLGYFFAIPKVGETLIDADTFVGKVVFYLWNDVFKDNDTSLFNIDKSKRTPTFESFYKEDEVTGASVPNPEAIKAFLIKVMDKDKDEENPIPAENKLESDEMTE